MEEITRVGGETPQADRKVLIKTIAQAIPTYTMGYFKLLLSLCHEIEAMVKKFF